MIGPMTSLAAVLVALVALAVGFAIGWFSRRPDLSTAGDLQKAIAEREIAVSERRRVEETAEALRARLEGEQQQRTAAETREREVERKLGEMQQFLTAAQQQLENSYAKLSQTALEAAVKQIQTMVTPHLERNRGEITTTLDAKKGEIEGLLTPVREMLVTYQSELKESEAKRNQGYASIEQQVKQLLEATEATRREASRVATALGNPKVSGSWGEHALQRCVELAGMTGYCDFTTQETVESREKERLRPDMTIRLPNDRKIPVDSKAPTQAYLEAAAEQDERRQKELLALHARNLRRHIDALSSREYHEALGDSVDFTVLFLGGEQFLYAALVADPSLFEYGAEKKVFIATPTVLVPLLRVVAAAWRAEQTEENAKRALEVGNELYERFLKVFRDIDAVGKALDGAVQKYNEAMRSIDSRLVPKGKELQARIASTKEIPELAAIDSGVLEATKVPLLSER